MRLWSLGTIFDCTVSLSIPNLQRESLVVFHLMQTRHIVGTCR